MALTPTDKLLAGYVGFVAVVIIARGDLTAPASWPLITVHALLGVLLYAFTRLPPGSRVGGVLHDLYPLLLLPVFYAEFAVLSANLGTEAVFRNDAVVQRWEEAIFGMQVSYEWIRRAPSVFWSALLHLGYLSYYPIIVLPPILLAVRGARRAARAVLFAMMLAFVACYVAFVLFPVAGPNYAFEHPTGPMRDVWSAQLVYGVLAGGSSFGAAFPSSHVAATLATVIALWREWRTLAWLFVLPTILLIVGTVYCQMHYGVDTLAGIGVGAAAGWAGRYMRHASHCLSSESPASSTAATISS